MKTTRLKTEYRDNPIGISIRKPRLMWNVEECEKQSAYEIIAEDEAGNVLLNTGKEMSSSMHYDWSKEEIRPCTRVFWKIRTWDENDIPSAFEQAWFETGLKEDEPWNAEWIAGNYKVNPKKRYPVDCFRKNFTVTDARKARLYITACGLYEASVNGKRAHDSILNPGITDYRKTIHYQTYDVTDLIEKGDNTIEIELADGWYRGSCGAWGRKNQYGTQTKVIAMLVMEEEGRKRIVSTDESWDWTNTGPIRFADNKDGEIVDAAMEPVYVKKAIAVKHPVIPCASDSGLITEHESFLPNLIITPSGKKVLDFHQNIAGSVSFSLYARSGDQVYLRFGEMLDENGEFTQKNIQCSNKKITTPLQEVRYTCREGRNDYRTKFAVFGFRYVLIETEIDFRPEDFTAHAAYSDMEETSSFESSSPLLNQFYANTVWSAKSNSADLPTDCPTRERHGWTGDAQIFCNTASYLFNYRTFAEKYLDDIYTWQKKNGCLPHIVPDGGADAYMNAMNGAAGWADAGIIMPYILWKKYDDIRIVKKYLSGMRKYADFVQKRCGAFYPTAVHTGLGRKERRYLNNAGQAYGEWAEPEEIYITTWKDCAVTHPETATAYTVYILELLSEMEEALGNEEESRKRKDFAEHCRKAYQTLREKSRRYSLDTDRQAQLVRPLYFRLLNEKQEEYAEKRLIEALDHYGWRIGTGFLSTPLILYVLEQIDPKYAYRLLENEELPGWLFMAKHGATTVWEAWEGNASSNQGIASLNHYSKGAVCSWLFEEMCGIHMEHENHFRIQPVPGGSFTYAKASYQSIYGTVKSGWEKTEEGCVFTVDLPCGCTGTVILPDGTQYEQTAGTRTYTCGKEGEES